MAEKLKIIPLGGLNEIGKNMTVLEYGKDIIIVDCGLGFPEDDMYGVDLVIADTSYLVKNQQKIRGMFLTHGHEDHIGGIPYAMQEFKCPIHATRLTAGIVRLKLALTAPQRNTGGHARQRVRQGRIGVCAAVRRVRLCVRLTACVPASFNHFADCNCQKQTPPKSILFRKE